MNLILQLNNQTGVPAYRQIMEQIGEYRQSGVLKADDKLPSIRALAKQLAVNPGTVVKAYHEMEHEGTIYSQHGKGVFIAAMQERSLSKDEREQPIRDAARQIWQQAQRMDLSADDLQRILREEQNHTKTPHE